MELCAEAARAGIKLSRLLDESGHPEAATDALATALKRDPLISEQYHQQLMIRLALRADRYAAIEHYRRYVRYLRAEVGDTPMHETTALAQHIKDGLPLGSLAALGSFGLSGHLTTSLM
ncbi:hypothetical protein EHF33_15025 [Deinococcus psychrotolerans]|uniref:Bacterial transcriptional activator domain-containing protein n=1 Tax=Deinococcus psychrotolerans TaxID=2489213 RepID=A0A3G8YFY9_9DEIO|nr:hypothetical protein EHF33_15025 [Deinococcus psychrotolerans]